MPGALGPEALTTNFIARNISSTCNSSGSVLWASAKNIQPLVDANYYTEAIELAYHQSPFRFSPIYYRNPESKSLPPSGQTILFGCPLELCTVGEQKKIPPILEYLLDSVHDWPEYYINSSAVGQTPRNCTTNSLYSQKEKYWPLVNELEQAWTGVEETDRVIISNLALQGKHRSLILVCPLRYTPQKAKRPCRYTLWPFQSQYGRMMISAWLGIQFATLQAWFGMLGIKIPLKSLFSEP